MPLGVCTELSGEWICAIELARTRGEIALGMTNNMIEDRVGLQGFHSILSPITHPITGAPYADPNCLCISFQLCFCALFELARLRNTRFLPASLYCRSASDANW